MSSSGAGVQLTGSQDAAMLVIRSGNSPKYLGGGRFYFALATALVANRWSSRITVDASVVGLDVSRFHFPIFDHKGVPLATVPTKDS